MHNYGLFLIGVVVYAVGNPIVKAITGIRPKGLAFWFYDAPAFISGVLFGIWLMLIHH
jgi:hypothetical protein